MTSSKLDHLVNYLEHLNQDQMIRDECNRTNKYFKNINSNKCIEYVRITEHIRSTKCVSKIHMMSTSSSSRGVLYYTLNRQNTTISTNYDEYCIQQTDHMDRISNSKHSMHEENKNKKQSKHHLVPNSSIINRIYFWVLNLILFCNLNFRSFKNHSTNHHHQRLSLINLFLVILISLNGLTNAKHSSVHSACPNAKQINDLKPANVNLNCDCTQTTDGHKGAGFGWEIMCYSIENSINANSESSVERSTTLPSTVDRTDNANRNAELVEEVTSDNLSLSNFGEEKVENDNFFAERLSSNDGNLEYVDELSLYRSVPIAFTIKYIANQLVSIECYENVPNFKPAMFQDFKIDEIDSFKILNCALPDIPFSLLFHRTSITSEVPNIRSLKLETLHTQSMDLNQFKKLFVNLESLTILTIDNYELDTNGKGLRMKRNQRTKRQIPFNRNSNLMSLVNNNFNERLANGQHQNITNSKQFFMNKMLRSTALNNALQNAMNNNGMNNVHNGPALHSNNGQSMNRFKSTPFNFVTPSSSINNYPLNNHQFESNRLINVRAIHNQKPPSSQFDPLLTMTTMSSSTIDDHASSIIFRHFDAINPTTNLPPSMSRFNNLNNLNNFNAFMRASSRLPNHDSTSSNLNLGNSFSPSSFQPSTFQTNSPSLNFNHISNNNYKFTTPIPLITTSTSTTTTASSMIRDRNISNSVSAPSSNSINSTTIRTTNSNLNNLNSTNHNDNNSNSLLTSDSRLISNHLPNNALPILSTALPSTTNRPSTYSMNLLSNSTSNGNDSFIGLENHNQPNRLKTPLLTNMLNKRNNTSRLSALTASANQSGNQLDRELTARKLNLNFVNYFPNLKILKIRSLLTNYDKDNAYFLKEMLTDLHSLETFEFSRNIIYVLGNNMFSTLGKLKYLYLNHNQIQQLERDALINLKMLETLELEDNDLKEINEETFRSLISLKQIKLKRNKFQKLPERLFSRNRNLVELDLSQNRDLTSLPDHLLRNLNQLHNLSVFDCQLIQISNNPQLFFANAPQLRVIYMRNNRLKYLNIRNLFAFNSELIKLDLSYNDITYLSSEIFSVNSSSLLELNLYANNLVEVPINVFTNLKNLRVLNLGFNNLTEVDVGIFFSLKNLEELDLSKNLLTSINLKKYALPFGIGTNLRKINLAHNKLSSFANEFGVINWSLYLMLTELNLSNNLLQGDLMLPVFYSSKMKLDLRQNLFTTILMDEIELNERTIIDLKPSKEKISKSQVSIYLAHNPINCDCRLFGFLNYTRTTNAKYSNLIEKVTFDTEYLECQQPEKLSRSPIEQINDSDLSCSINNANVCPKVCECRYITKYRQVDVDCQLKALNKPPAKVLLMSNYDNIDLDGSEQKLSNKQIDLISLKFQHNRIRNMDTFNSALFKNNTVKRRSTPMMLELYLDNNTIDTISDNFLNLTINSFVQSAPLSIASSTNATTKNRKQTGNHQTQSVYLKTLSITNNQLEYVPVDFLNRLVKLTSSESTIQSLPQFKLYLSSNPFNCTPVQQPLNRKTVATNNEQDDRYVYDECYVKEMKNWLTKNYDYVGDLGDIKCYDSSNKNNSKQLIQFTDDQLCPRETEDKSTTLFLLYICIGLTSLLFILTVFYFKNRQTILAFVYIHVHPIFFICGFNEEDLDEEKLYDAFVSYSSQDRDVVMSLIEHLEQPSKQTNNSLNYLQSRNGLPTFHEANADKIVPDMMNAISNNSSSTANGLKMPASLKNNSTSNDTSLMNNANHSANTLNSKAVQNTLNTATGEDNEDYFKLCIHERDWLPGQLISWNIINSVRNSRRTILVLSKSFIESIWFQIEFHTAYYQMLEDKMDRLIVIVKGELPDREHLDKDLAFLLSTKTYLVWGEKYFWEKLKYSLPHKRSFKEKNKAIKPLMNGNNLKLHDFGTYSTTPTSLNSLTNRNTLYSNSKLSSKAKYMEECINNAISDYYKLEKKTTTESSESNNRKVDNGYDLERKMKSNKYHQDDKYSGQLNPSFENETET